MWPFSRIRALEAECDRLRTNLHKEVDTHTKEETNLRNEASALRNQVEYLVRTLRKTDDIIFSMGQCTDWKSMQPRFAQLHDEMTARKVAESDRIGDLMRTELVKTYGPTDASPPTLPKP